MRTNIKSLFLALLIVVLSACQKTPQSEIDEAKALLDSAQTKNIHNIYPEEFQLLKDSINVVFVRIEAQKSKPALKKYDKYKKQLKNLIDEIKQLIQMNKES